jgi:dCMP deaminase
VKKRNDYISWDEYFMGVAILSAKRSKDPNTQVGACIVNKKNRIVGTGYNGLPAGCSDDDFPWDKQGEFLETKYPYVCHAELNAILNNIGMDLAGCRIYTALFPCNECSKAIIQSGISEVVYLSDKYEATDTAKASKRMLENASVVCRKVITNIKHLQISFEEKDV